MALQSWVEYEESCNFPIQNLPYGLYTLKEEKDNDGHICTAIGDYVFDFYTAVKEDVFGDNLSLDIKNALVKDTLNSFMKLGRKSWKLVRTVLKNILNKDNKDKDLIKLIKEKVLVNMKDVSMKLPARIGDYTDFYSSRYHATNVGKMFRPGQAALKPNWVHLPVGYHGRSSSVVVSGTDIKRPCGQKTPKEEGGKSTYSKCNLLDFELEMAFYVGPGNKLGDPIKMKDSEDNIFGLVVMNDWSARDIQKWEYIPLGPFGGKNFATTVAPWIVTLDALEEFKIDNQKKEPEVLDYLKEEKEYAYDIKLEVYLKGDDMKEEERIVASNSKYLYWTFKQQLVHHSVTGCNMQPGDLLGSGTISGPERSEYGSMLELCWKGTKPIELKDGKTRKFLKDGDVVRMTGYCQGEGYRIGFGNATGKILPANE